HLTNSSCRKNQKSPSSQRQPGRAFCPCVTHPDSCAANLSASVLPALPPRTEASVASPAHGGTAPLCAHRIRECATNPEIRTAGSQDDGKIRGRACSVTCRKR